MRNRENERNLARQLQEHRDDESQWEDEPEEATVNRPASVVYSVRFAPNEIEEIRRSAAEMGVTPSEFVRRAAFEKIHRIAAPKNYTSAVRLMHWHSRALLSNTIDTGGARSEPDIRTAGKELAETA